MKLNTQIVFFSICILVIFLLFACTESKNYSKVMDTAFSISTKQDFTISVPETNAKCKLDAFLTDNDIQTNIIGSYVKGDERGSVVANISQITPLNNLSDLSNTDKNIFYFVLPFTVSNQGSGIFYWLGLFKLNTKSRKLEHLDSAFLGDRIFIEKIQIKNNSVQEKTLITILLKTHAENQAMSEYPNAETQKNLIIIDGIFK